MIKHLQYRSIFETFFKKYEQRFKIFFELDKIRHVFSRKREIFSEIEISLYKFSSKWRLLEIYGASIEEISHKFLSRSEKLSS